MASHTLLTPTSKPITVAAVTSAVSVTLSSLKPKPTTTPPQPLRRHFLSLAATTTISSAFLFPLITPSPAMAADEEYVNDTKEVIGKVRSTISLAKGDPNAAAAVAELRETSNSWVAKYRKEKSLIGKPSFRDMYSALNAVSGHYISFGPTAPIPAKRKQRILEEMDTAEKALIRGR